MPQKGSRRRVRYAGRRYYIRVFLLLILLTTSTFLFLQSSYFNVSEIVISGNSTVSSREAEKMSGIQKGINIFRVDTESIREKLLLHPMIASVEIKRSLPRTVNLKIKEYVPAAVVPVEEGFMEVSIEGYSLKISSEISHLNLPVISGTGITRSVQPGNKVDNDKLDAGLQVTDCIGSNGTIAEIDVHDLMRINMFTFSKTKILLGNDQQLQKKIGLALDISSRVPTAEYIDVRFPKSPVYK